MNTFKAGDKVDVFGRMGTVVGIGPSTYDPRNEWVTVRYDDEPAITRDELVSTLR